MKYRVISTDDHLQEHPQTYTSRMSAAKWGDKIPQVVANDDGTDSWSIYGQKRPKGKFGGVGPAGVMPDRTKAPQRWEDVPKIAYVPAERVRAMDQDGVDVHSFFGQIAGVAGNTFSNPSYKEEDYRLECIQAYNDFQMEEYHDAFPGRFITLAILPMWDVDKALVEARRMAARGAHGISFAFPQQFGFPHIADKYWDPLWAFAQETDLSVNFHIGSGGSMGMGSEIWSGHIPMVNLAETSVKSIAANTQVMTTLLFSQMLERFPKMKLVSSESGLGWVPYLLEVADHQWERQRLWKEGMTIKPSEYFHRQCYVNFWFEDVGIKMREHIGIDNIMWESDFPHPTCTWPTSQDYIERSLAQVSPEERQKILVDNAVALFQLGKYQD